MERRGVFAESQGGFNNINNSTPFERMLGLSKTRVLQS